MTSELNFSAHSPQFVRGPLDGVAWIIPRTTQAVEMQCGRLICRYKRLDENTFLFVRCWPSGPEGDG